MSGDDLRRAGAALADRSRQAQGLPETITDDAALARVARLLLAPAKDDALRIEAGAALPGGKDGDPF